jgi:hypothetical protein
MKFIVANALKVILEKHVINFVMKDVKLEFVVEMGFVKIVQEGIIWIQKALQDVQNVLKIVQLQRFLCVSCPMVK